MTAHVVSVTENEHAVLLSGRKTFHVLDGDLAGARLGDALVFAPNGDELRAIWKTISYLESSVASLGRPVTLNADYRTVLGVDPGLASVGVCGIRRDLRDGRTTCAGAMVITTKRDNKEGVIRDDMRRLREIWSRLERAVETLCPDAIGVEVYTVYDSRAHETVKAAAEKLLGQMAGTASLSNFIAACSYPETATRVQEILIELEVGVRQFGQQRGRGDAAKVLGVYYATACLGARYGIPVFPFMPASIKAKVGGARNASKTQVERGIKRLVPGIEEVVARDVTAKGLRNHVYDAAAHGLLALDEVIRYDPHARLGRT